jgi:hypothetical protein
MKKIWLASTPLKPSGSAVFRSAIEMSSRVRDRAMKSSGVETRTRTSATAKGSICWTAILAKE